MAGRNKFGPCTTSVRPGSMRARGSRRATCHKALIISSDLLEALNPHQAYEEAATDIIIADDLLDRLKY